MRKCLMASGLAQEQCDKHIKQLFGRGNERWVSQLSKDQGRLVKRNNSNRLSRLQVVWRPKRNSQTVLQSECRVNQGSTQFTERSSHLFRVHKQSIPTSERHYSRLPGTLGGRAQLGAQMFGLIKTAGTSCPQWQARIIWLGSRRKCIEMLAQAKDLWNSQKVEFCPV